MARALRLNVVNGWYHVTNRGIERREVFGDERCYGHFTELIGEAVERFGLRVHAYVLMPNHFHLVVQTPEANLSSAMQWLSTSYSMWFNRRQNRVGPLFQGRFKGILFDGRNEGWVVTRYVHLNPIRVKGLDLDKCQSKAESMGLVPVPVELLRKRLEALRDYRWSSYPAYAGWSVEPEWLTVNAVLVGGQKRGLEEQRMAYRTYVESVLGQVLPVSPMDSAAGGLLLGDASWVEKMRRLVKGNRLEQKALRCLEKRPGWEDVRKAVETVKGEEWERFRDRHGDWGRDLALYLARRHGGLSLPVLAGCSGASSYDAVSKALHRMAVRLKEDEQMRKLADKAAACLVVQT